MEDKLKIVEWLYKGLMTNHAPEWDEIKDSISKEPTLSDFLNQLDKSSLEQHEKVMQHERDISERIASNRGIYGIFYGNKVYIGKSKSISDRIQQHKHVLRKGKHSIAKLQDDWDDANDRFEFRVLETHTPESELTEREREYIIKYAENGHEMYNTVHVINKQPEPDENQRLFDRIGRLIAQGRLDKDQLSGYLDQL